MYAWDIIVVGCGATGSHYISMLSQLAINNSFIKSITLVDKDIVEEKNLRNQKFTIKDVGKSKASVLATRYAKLGIDIGYNDSFIESSHDVYKIVDNVNENHVIIVCCVDNNDARLNISKFFREYNKKYLVYIDVGNDAETKKGQAVLGIKNKEEIISPCVDDYFNLTSEEVVEELGCEQINTNKPQHFVANVFSSTIAFLMTSSVLEDNIQTQVAMFDADTINIKKY